jgi:putative ABC transport system ATP-binding protein
MFHEVTVKVSNVVKVYRTKTEHVTVLRNVSLTLSSSEIIVVMGPSGVGKTTLLKVIYGVLLPDKGIVEVMGSNIYELTRRDRDKLMLQFVGYMPQEDRLLETLNIEENLALPLLALGYSKKIIQQRVKQLLSLMDTEKLAKRFPNELSMGQRRKILLLRALANDPLILLLDEPTANIDSAGVESILEYLKYLKEERNMSILLTSHDYRVVKIADKVFWLSDGTLKILEDLTKNKPR